jgi:adenylyltransferase/sulfurtransferase
VLGVLPGIVGAIQAGQAINLLLGKGEPLIGRLLVFNATDYSFTELRLRKNAQCPVCGTNPTVKELIDYEQFCGVKRDQASARDISPIELKTQMEHGKKFTLLDVREPFEYGICRLDGATLVPLGSLPEKLRELDSRNEIVVYCHTGTRSARAAELLEAAGFTKVRNLRGGIRAWAEDVDRAMPRY